MWEVDAWRQLLPQYVEVSAGPQLNDGPAITPAERESAGIMGARRTLEFSNGRAYAKMALSRLGLEDVELPVGADRAPLWPDGVTGSITHAMRLDGGHFAAAVSRTGSGLNIGIDAEYVDDVRPETWSQFLTPLELEQIRSSPVATRAGKSCAIWCAKEATIKATGHALDPKSIEVIPECEPAGALEIWRIQCADSRVRSTPVRARTVRLSGMVLGAVVLHEEGAW